MNKEIDWHGEPRARDAIAKLALRAAIVGAHSMLFGIRGDDSRGAWLPLESSPACGWAERDALV